MSLNGLDSPDVQEAHQVAVGEAGGWFLLKYVSRDSVELLGRGKRGIPEARNAIASYTDSSPLYGLIIFRRRKVLIKYIPEGTSRVLLARTAVHFQDVLEKYSPYETLLEIKTPEGLNDTSLAASFPLHTATPSASSSRLDEINEDEDEEDNVSSIQTPTSQVTSNGSYFGSQRQRKDWRAEKSPPPSIHIRGDSLDKPSSAQSPKKPHVSQFIVRDDSGQQSISSLVTPGTIPGAFPVTPYADEEDSERDTQYSLAGSETPKATTPTTPRFKPLPAAPSEQSVIPKVPEKSSERYSRTSEVRMPKGPPEQNTAERPTTSTTISTISTVSERSKYDDDPYDFSRFDVKPKQKLGPRPVAPGEKSRRPLVASISSLPATYRPTMKKPELQSRPKSQGPISAAIMANGIPKGMPAPPPIPDLPEYNPRPVSRGSIKSLPSHKSTAMTPDKLRLMKAVELRKKQMRKSNPQAGTFVPPPDGEVPAVPAMPEPPQTREVDQPKERTPQVESIVREATRASSYKSDSGIEMEYDNPGRRDDEKPAEVNEPQESREIPSEPLPAAAKPQEVPLPQSPRADTPRDINGQSFEADEDDGQAMEGTTKDEDLSQTPTPRGLTHPDSAPESQPSRVEKERDDGPALPMSRHALPVDNSIRNPSISEPHPSEDTGNVPTIVMEDGSRPLSALIKEARSEDSTPDESDSDEKSVYESANSSGDLVPPEKNLQRKTSDIAKRRRGFVEPLQLDGDNEFSSDEEFMDELQSATLQEAKPITVARSPVAHYFPRRPSYNSVTSDADVNSVRKVTVGDRASAMPLGYTDSEGRLSPDPTESPGHTRSISTPLMEKDDPMSGARRNMSNGISRRIPTLAEKSSREGSFSDNTSSRPVSPESPETYSPMDPRQQIRNPPPPNSRTSSFRAMSRHSSRMSAYQSIVAPNPVQQPDHNTVWNVENGNSSGVGSVSVTARIVRPTPIQETEPKPDVETEFQSSKLVVSSHKRGAQSQSSVPLLQKIDTSPRLDGTAASTTTSPTTLRASVDNTRQLHSAGNRFGRYKPSSPTVDDFPVPPPSNKAYIPQPMPMNEESIAPRETTRTSRFFKRMSNITGNKKRMSTVAQSISSSGSPASERGSLIANNASLPGSKDRIELPPALTVGDLNIQFPDSLLWKRRIVQIDEAGFITFSISQAMEHQRGATKRYQLSEFRMPYIPDLDRLELPNSIMLDFVDGTTLQIACEDGMTHRQVTHVLKTYWRAWTMS